MPNSSGLIQIKRDLIKVGGTSLTGADWTAILKALIDDSIKGVLRSLGDAGASPTNIQGKTALYKLYEIERRVRSLDGDIPSQVIKSASQSGAGITVIHTVSTGKSLYLVFAFLSGASGGGSGTVNVSVRDDGDNWLYNIAQISFDAANMTDSVACSLPRPLKIPEGYDVYVESTTNPTARATILGWEE